MDAMSDQEPFVAPDSDLRGLRFMPLDVVRLMDSDLFASSTGDEFKAAVALWCKAWLQVPAGSLPDDDRILAHLSGAGGKWNKLRAMALHGFVRCNDGRFYHPVICEKVREAWSMRIRQRERSVNGNAKRWGSPKDDARDPRRDPRRDPTCDPRSDPRRDRKGQGQRQGQGSLRKKGGRKAAGAREAPDQEVGIPDPEAETNEVLAFEGKAIRLTAESLGRCREVYPHDDLTSRLRVYDAKFVERAEFPALSRIMVWLTRDAAEPLAREPLTANGRQPEANGYDRLSDPRTDEQIQREARVQSFLRTGFWYPAFGDTPTEVECEAARRKHNARSPPIANAAGRASKGS
jgi:hypothetical protein